MKILDTERLTLREFTGDDAPFMLRLLNEPSFIRNIGDRGVRTVEDAAAYLRKGPIASYERFGFGLCMVEVRDEAIPIGICGLIKRDTLPDVDLGFAFLPEFWSKGYALESAAAILAWGMDGMGLTRVVAIVSPDNERSIRVLGRLGMRYEGMIAWPDEETELKLYAIGIAGVASGGAARPG